MEPFGKSRTVPARKSLAGAVATPASQDARRDVRRKTLGASSGSASPESPRDLRPEQSAGLVSSNVSMRRALFSEARGMLAKKRQSEPSMNRTESMRAAAEVVSSAVRRTLTRSNAVDAFRKNHHDHQQALSGNVDDLSDQSSEGGELPRAESRITVIKQIGILVPSLPTPDANRIKDELKFFRRSLAELDEACLLDMRRASEATEEMKLCIQTALRAAGFLGKEESTLSKVSASAWASIKTSLSEVVALVKGAAENPEALHDYCQLPKATGANPCDVSEQPSAHNPQVQHTDGSSSLSEKPIDSASDSTHAKSRKTQDPDPCESEDRLLDGAADASGEIANPTSSREHLHNEASPPEHSSSRRASEEESSLWQIAPDDAENPEENFSVLNSQLPRYAQPSSSNKQMFSAVRGESLYSGDVVDGHRRQKSDFYRLMSSWTDTRYSAAQSPRQLWVATLLPSVQRQMTERAGERVTLETVCLGRIVGDRLGASETQSRQNWNTSHHGRGAPRLPPIAVEPRMKRHILVEAAQAELESTSAGRRKWHPYGRTPLARNRAGRPPLGGSYQVS